MRRYLLDGGPLGAYFLGRKAAVDAISPWIVNHEVVTSILVYGEVIEYLKGLPNFEQRQNDFQDLLSEIHPHLLTYSILDRYADLRRNLRPPYGPGLIGDIDTIIAATAIEYDLVLVTVDHDFERVPGLQVKIIDTRAR